jgi:ankyrin repeat protein
LLAQADASTKEHVQQAFEGASDAGNAEVLECLLSWAEENDYSADFGDMMSRVFLSSRVGALSMLLTQYEGRISAGDGSPVPDDLLLVFAVKCGRVEIVARLVDAGVDVNSKVEALTGTALSYASDPVMVKMLLEAKADVNPEDCDTVFKAACEKLNIEAVKMLLDAGATAVGVAKGAVPHVPCPDKQAEDKIAILNLLLDAEGDACGDKEQSAVLRECTRAVDGTDRVMTVNALLSRNPRLLEYEEDGDTLLMSLVKRVGKETGPRPPLIKAVLEHGANVNARDKREKPVLFRVFDSTLFHYQDKREVMRMLLDAGADATVVACDKSVDITLLMSIVMYVDDFASSIFISDVLDSAMFTRK